MNFYEVSSNRLDELTKNELKIYNYVLENMEYMPTKTIRALAKECYVSTTTIVRLVKKLGFGGYNEMIIVIKYTINEKDDNLTSITEDCVRYKEEYAKNIVETIRVMDEKQTLKIVNKIKKSDKLYIFTRGIMHSYGAYMEFLFELKGIDTYFATNSYYRNFYSKNVSENDVIIVIDYYGNDPELLKVITTVKTNGCKNIVTITQANNNIIQNLSNYNLYYFSDTNVINGFDITSNVSAMAILELLVHNI